MLNLHPSAAMREYLPISLSGGKRRLNFLRMCRKVFGRRFACCWMKAEADGTSSGRKKIFQQFMVDASASRAEEEMDQLYKPRFPAVGKILSGVSDELGSVARHVIHDCPECGFELLWE